MAFELANAGRMKAAMETMAHRLRNMKVQTEKTLDQASSVAFTGGTALALGYANERWGKAPTDDAGGYKELTVMSVPVDMLAGGAALAGVFLGAFGKYDQFALSIGNGATSAFAYRFGAEVARKHATQAAPAQTAASGALGPGAPAASAWTGRPRHVTFAP
jgi:hypothetical protein